MNKCKLKYFIIFFSFCFFSSISLSQTSQESLAALHKYGWGFGNFRDDSLMNWDIYCHSFYGITSDSERVTNVFDMIFYEEAFKTNAALAGHCMGMSLLSLMMNKYGGYLGFCVPPIRHGGKSALDDSPANPELKRAVKIMQGRGFGLACIQEYINQGNNGHSLNASYGLNLVIQTLAREGPCVVGITKSKNPLTGESHALIAYEVTGSGSYYQIWVVDPNRFYTLDTSGDLRKNIDFYDSAKNFIEIQHVSGEEWNWTYNQAGWFTPWPNDVTEDEDDANKQNNVIGPIGEGNLVVLPVSIIGPPSRTPSSLGLDVAFLLTQLIVWGASTDENILLYTDEGCEMLGKIDFPDIYNQKYIYPLCNPKIINQNLKKDIHCLISGQYNSGTTVLRSYYETMYCR